MRREWKGRDPAGAPRRLSRHSGLWQMAGCMMASLFFRFWAMIRADGFADMVIAVSFEKRLQPVKDGGDDSRPIIDERGVDLEKRRAGADFFVSLFRRGDSADSDDGDRAVGHFVKFSDCLIGEGREGFSRESACFFGVDSIHESFAFYCRICGDDAVQFFF